MGFYTRQHFVNRLGVLYNVHLSEIFSMLGAYTLFSDVHRVLCILRNCIVHSYGHYLVSL